MPEATRIEYELFISYSRADNQAPPGEVGWVTALHQRIAEDHAEVSSDPFRIFFDTREIRDMDDWRNRILGALRTSKILLVCLSPNYHRSQYCKWEWEEYLRRRIHQLIGDESIATVYFVEVPGSDAAQNREWHESILRPNFTDLRPWFPEGPRALREEEARQRIRNLGVSLWQRIERARRAAAAVGNLRRPSPYFVGRSRELADLHAKLAKDRIGVITAVHGLGGQGKTELAIAYANGYADCYPGGLWVVKAEGRDDLLELVGTLADEPRLGFQATEAQRQKPHLLGKAVLEHLHQRALAAAHADRDGGPAALVILDNVDQPLLLAPTQLSRLPELDSLRMVATTRLGETDLRDERSALLFVEVDSLPLEDALALVRDHQPGGRFSSSTEEDAAAALCAELGGFTLAIEQVAVYLGLYRKEGVEPSKVLATFRAKGITRGDGYAEREAVRERIEHEDPRLAIILDATLERLADQPAALACLHLAAHLPPDTIPWFWLEMLVKERHPELAAERDEDAPDPWLLLRRRLEGAHLLMPGTSEHTGRMHRLIAAHLRERADAWQSAADRLAIEQVAARTANLVNQMAEAPAPWVLDALVETLSHLLPGSSDKSSLTVEAVYLSDKLLAYSNVSTARRVADMAHERLLERARRDPANAEWQRDLAASWQRIGDRMVAVGDGEGAVRAYEALLATAKRLAELDPSNSDWQRNLSVSWSKTGDLRLRLGDGDGARKAFEAGLAIRQDLARRDPANAGWQRDLSVSWNRIGDLRLRLGDADGARQAFEASLAIRQDLARRDPANAEWQRDLTVSWNKIGDLRLSFGDGDGAREAFEEALKIAQDLARRDPANAEWQRDLSVSWERIGDLRLRLGDGDGAREGFEEALKIAQDLARRDPANAGWQRDLSVSWSKIGDLRLRLGDGDGAREAFEEALKIAQDLARRDPANAEWQRDLSVSWNRIGDLRLRLGDGDGAQKAFEASLAIRQDLARRDPANAEWQRDLSVSWERIGNQCLRLGDGDGAREAFAASLKIAQDLARRDPANAGWQRDLSVSWSKIGDLRLRLGDGDGAREAFEEALKIAQDLARRDPANAEWQRDLAISHAKHAQLHMRTQRLAEALPHWISAHEAFARILVLMPNVPQAALDAANSAFDTAACLMQLGRRDEAVPHLQTAAGIALQLRKAGQPLSERLEALLRFLDGQQGGGAKTE